MIRRFFIDDEGEDMIEYGLLASLISIVSLLTIKLIGPLITPLYEMIKSALTL